MKKLLAGILILLGCCSGVYYSQSQSKDLHLSVAKQCYLKYSGDNCEEVYEITNTTTEDLNGNATLHIDYEGICGNVNFDGEGIEVKYNNNIPNTKWINGSISFSDFTISKGHSFSVIKMNTDVALCPGTYTYTFILTGIADIQYSSSGSGGFVFPTPESKEKVIIEGELIRNPNAPGMAQHDIYIVKLVDNKRFKRLILNPHVFESYQHLSWDNVKLVDYTTMRSYKTSSLVRVQDYDIGVFENKVYQLFPNGDIGIKRHLNISQIEFERRGYDADSIYNINIVDRDAYITGEDIL